MSAAALSEVHGSGPPSPQSPSEKLYGASVDGVNMSKQQDDASPSPREDKSHGFELRNQRQSAQRPEKGSPDGEQKCSPKSDDNEDEKRFTDDDDGDIDGDEFDDESDDDSLLEDIFAAEESFSNDHVVGDGSFEACTPAEAAAFRKRLRQVGLDAFVSETISAGAITAKKLCTAFGTRPPSHLDGEPDQAYYRILGLALCRELASRQKLEEYNTIEDVVNLLQKSSNILVITGAGISTNLGIPDFRSKDTGFYAKMREKGFSSGEEVFNIDLFEEDPHNFYDNCGDTLPREGVTSPTHEFIHLLQQREKLLTNYTQNIDNIEANAGILPSKLIQCHGSWATATCRKCKFQVPGKVIIPDVREGKVPICRRCKEMLQVVPQLKRKRSSNSTPKWRRRQGNSDDSDDDNAYDIPQPGVMKPDITFFGEQLPKDFFDRFREDINLVDLVLVIGTSMKVAPVSEIPSAVPAKVPHVYISRDPCRHIRFDVTLLGDCDLIVGELAKRTGWNLEHPMNPKMRSAEVQSWEGQTCVWTVNSRSAGDPATRASLIESTLLPDKPAIPSIAINNAGTTA